MTMAVYRLTFWSFATSPSPVNSSPGLVLDTNLTIVSAITFVVLQAEVISPRTPNNQTKYDEFKVSLSHPPSFPLWALLVMSIEGLRFIVRNETGIDRRRAGSGSAMLNS